MAKILLVEDNSLAAFSAQLIIERLGHSIDIVASGREALAVYNNGYDAILLDIGLPDMDGIIIVKTIRELETHNTNIPIIALTAHEDENLQSNSLEAGMNAYLTKPLDSKKLEAVLADLT